MPCRGGAAFPAAEIGGAKMKLVLASSSPRRVDILRFRGYEFTADPADIVEYFDRSLPVREAMEALALAKATAVAPRHPGDAVLAADTMVFLGGEPIGKPDGKNGAREMLRALSGRSHEVITGGALVWPDGKQTFSVVTTVVFYELTDAQIERYVASGEPLGKAGSYAIQGAGSMLVRYVEGDYLNIVGLPLGETEKHLSGLGIYPRADMTGAFGQKTC